MDGDKNQVVGAHNSSGEKKKKNPKETAQNSHQFATLDINFNGQRTKRWRDKKTKAATHNLTKQQRRKPSSSLVFNAAKHL